MSEELEELFEAFQPASPPVPEARPPAGRTKGARKRRDPRRTATPPVAASTEQPSAAPVEPAPAAPAPTRQKRQYTRRAAASPATDDMEVFSAMYKRLADMDKRRRARIVEMLAKVFA